MMSIGNFDPIHPRIHHSVQNCRVWKIEAALAGMRIPMDAQPSVGRYPPVSVLSSGVTFRDGDDLDVQKASQVAH